MDLKFFNSSDSIRGKHNIFIGISLGVLKPLTPVLAKEYISWALENTKDKVVILIADEIAKYNYQVFSGFSPGKAENRALLEGERYAAFFSDVLEDFSEADRQRVSVLRWADIWSSLHDRLKVILDDEYSSNSGFRETIDFFLDRYASRRGKTLYPEQTTFLSQYVLSELPTLFAGIFCQVEFDLLLYPTFSDSGMSQLVVDILDGRIFPELRDKLGLKKKVVLVESYIPFV